LFDWASAFSGHGLSAIMRRMADEKQKRPSPFIASRLIRVMSLTFAVIWLLYVLYADPTRGTVNMAVSRTYLSLSGLFFVLVFAFHAVANSVKILEERLKRLEETQSQSQNRGNAS
jgi:peptidoglycan/LPS O-acetylase OafA/YrhL